jgi:hypothetical protein
MLIELSEREHATVLAALASVNAHSLGECLPEFFHEHKALASAAIERLRRRLNFECDPIWVVLHTHRHGVSIYHMRSAQRPGEDEAVKALEIDFEPDREEFLDIERMDEKLAGLTKTRVARKGKKI